LASESSFVTLFPLEVNVILEASIAVILHRVRTIFLNDCILVLIASKSNFWNWGTSFISHRLRPGGWCAVILRNNASVSFFRVHGRLGSYSHLYSA